MAKDGLLSKEELEKIRECWKEPPTNFDEFVDLFFDKDDYYITDIPDLFTHIDTLTKTAKELRSALQKTKDWQRSISCFDDCNSQFVYGNDQRPCNCPDPEVVAALTNTAWLEEEGIS